jgi:hypothetical protein
MLKILALLIATYMSEKDVKEKFEDTKGLIRSRKSEDRQYNGQ